MPVYNRYSDYLKAKYGVKTYKLSVNIDLSCPNRDGNLGTEGCFFCGEDGAALEKKDSRSVRKQLLRLKKIIKNKYQAEKFIAYFQNFSNTYLPLEQLKDNIEQALQIEDIVEICLSTRPDCVNDQYLAEIKKIVTKADKKLTIELGLQTVNYHTLKKCNRQHGLAEFIDAVLTAKRHNIGTGVHLILNLPGDKITDVIESAKIMSAFRVSNVKLHGLYIRKNTHFARLYERGQLQMISLDEYIKRVITFLEYLDPEIAVQRLLGKAPQEKTLFVNWGRSYQQIINMIINEMQERETYQGRKFDYLQGKALNIFK